MIATYTFVNLLEKMVSITHYDSFMTHRMTSLMTSGCLNCVIQHNSDKDIRFMATNDLLTELQKEMYDSPI